jgi:hypothetical protein
MPKFLETITFMGGDILIAISDIKCVYISYKGKSHVIVIKCFSETETEEHFDDENAMANRYQQIKKILEAE